MTHSTAALKACLESRDAFATHWDTIKIHLDRAEAHPVSRELVHESSDSLEAHSDPSMTHQTVLRTCSNSLRHSIRFSLAGSYKLTTKETH